MHFHLLGCVRNPPRRAQGFSRSSSGRSSCRAPAKLKLKRFRCSRTKRRVSLNRYLLAESGYHSSMAPLLNHWLTVLIVFFKRACQEDRRLYKFCLPAHSYAALAVVNSIGLLLFYQKWPRRQRFRLHWNTFRPAILFFVQSSIHSSEVSRWNHSIDPRIEDDLNSGFKPFPFITIRNFTNSFRVD